MTASQKLLVMAALWTPLGMAQSRYVNDVLALNPLGYWRLDGNTSDASTNANGGVSPNGVTFTGAGGGAPVGDPNSQAAQFNRATIQYITMGSTASSAPFQLDWNHPLTMMVWVKTTDTTGAIILAKAENTGNFRGPYLFIDDGGAGGVAPTGAGRFGMIIQAAPPTGAGLTGGNFLGVEALPSINDGNWHFVVGTYDGSGQASGVKLYIDGAAASTSVVGNGNSLGGLSTLNTAPVTIGSRDGGGLPFGGFLDEAAIFGTALTAAQVQQLENDTLTSNRLLSQWAFGGGWYSALYFTNTGTSAISFPVNFTADNGTPLTIPSLGGASTNVNIPGRGTVIIEALNSGALNQGYVSVALPGGVVGYGVFRQSVSGFPDQEAVVPLTSTSSTTSTLLWDDTNFVTGVAIVNPSSISTSVSIVVRDANGNTIGTANVALNAKSKTAIALRDLPGLAAMRGTRGSADFTVAFGNVSVLGLRFNGTAFTSIPTTER